MLDYGFKKLTAAATGQNTGVDHLVCAVEVDSRGRVIQLKRIHLVVLLLQTGRQVVSLLSRNVTTYISMHGI